MKRNAGWLVVLILAEFMTAGAAVGKPIGVNRTNFYLLDWKDQIFYPIGVNAGYLLAPDVPLEEIDRSLHMFTVAGANTIRINLDDALPRKRKATIEAADGTVRAELLERVDQIMAMCDRLGLVVIFSLWDIQRLEEEWDNHPYNARNGGRCATPEDFFMNPTQRMRSIRRIDQVAARYGKYDGLIWEMGRGLNVDELPGTVDPAYSKKIAFWTVYMMDRVRRADPQAHLLALSFLPNTLPYSLMDIQPANLFFLSIEARDALQAAQSTQQFIQTARQFRRPVFIGETAWKGPAFERDGYVLDMLWSSLAASSGTFLTPERDESKPRIYDSDLALLLGIRLFLPLVKLDGKPRPPSEAPLELIPKDSCLVVDSLVGNDWLFWLRRKGGGEGKMQVLFHTVEGWYEVQWFGMENLQRGENVSRRILQKVLRLESPEFGHAVIGRLRYVKPLEKEALPASGVENATTAATPSASP